MAFYSQIYILISVFFFGVGLFNYQYLADLFSHKKMIISSSLTAIVMLLILFNFLELNYVAFTQGWEPAVIFIIEHVPAIFYITSIILTLEISCYTGLMAGAYLGCKVLNSRYFNKNVEMIEIRFIYKRTHVKGPI
jgi:hypothetical protein